MELKKLSLSSRTFWIIIRIMKTASTRPRPNQHSLEPVRNYPEIFGKFSYDCHCIVLSCTAYRAVEQAEHAAHEDKGSI